MRLRKSRPFKFFAMKERMRGLQQSDESYDVSVWSTSSLSSSKPFCRFVVEMGILLINSDIFGRLIREYHSDVRGGAAGDTNE